MKDSLCWFQGFYIYYYCRWFQQFWAAKRGFCVTLHAKHAATGRVWNALPASQNDLNRTTDMQAEPLGESGSQTMQTCPQVILGVLSMHVCGLVPPRNLPKTSRPIFTTHSLFTQRWRSKRFTQVRDEVRKLTSCRRDFASTSQFTTY